MAEPSPSKNHSTSSRGVSACWPANLQLRNSESTDPKRRSFVGSPFPRPSINTGQGGSGGFHPNTPANSPSDYPPRRNSIGKENMSMASRDNHKRENDADLTRKPGKVQSPAATKGSKHFMSSTISAASKVNASPRKKVLVEKDEPSRTSIPFSGGKLPCMEGSVPKPEKGLNQKKEVSFDSNVTYLGDDKEEAIQSEDVLDPKVDSSSTDMPSLLETEIEEKDLNLDPSFKISTRHGDPSPLPTSSLASGDVLDPKVDSSSTDMPSLLETEIEEKDLNLDPSFKISTRHGDPSPLPTSSLASGDVMPPLSPLDADPYMVPYDPKTNYLSPRPRFLHYKHNPRVELYLLKGKSDLKEIFSADSLSNAEVIEDEVSSDGFLVEMEEDLSSDVASDDGSYKKEEEEEEESLALSEEDHTSASEADSEVTEVKKKVKQHVTRTKFIPMLFILASVGLYLSFYSSSVMEPSVLNNLNLPELYVPPQLSNFARESFEEVAQRIQPLLHRCKSYLHNLIIGFSQQHNMAALEYANLTLLEDRLVDEARVFFSNSAFIMAAKFETGSSWLVTDGDVNLVSVMKRGHQHIEATEEVLQGDVHGQESDDEEEIEAFSNLDLSGDHTSNEAGETNVAELVDNSSLEAALVLEQGQQDNSEHLVQDTFAQVEGIPGDNSATLGVPEANMDTLAGTSELQSIIPGEMDVTPAEIQDQPITATREMASAHAVAGIAMLALITGLLAAIALFYRSPEALPTNDATLASQKATQMIEEKANPIVPATPTGQSNLLTEVEYTSDEDTCGSQPTASSHRKGSNARRTSQEDWSHKRRETSASSSMESKSYGSFTTYEKFPAKHNVGGDEQAVITPVRRSSRVRSKVGSLETSDMMMMS